MGRAAVSAGPEFPRALSRRARGGSDTTPSNRGDVRGDVAPHACPGRGCPLGCGDVGCRVCNCRPNRSATDSHTMASIAVLTSRWTADDDIGGRPRASRAAGSEPGSTRRRQATRWSDQVHGEGPRFGCTTVPDPAAASGDPRRWPRWRGGGWGSARQLPVQQLMMTAATVNAASARV
jgi:hypothetical protein